MRYGIQRQLLHNVSSNPGLMTLPPPPPAWTMMIPPHLRAHSLSPYFSPGTNGGGGDKSPTSFSRPCCPLFPRGKWRCEEEMEWTSILLLLPTLFCDAAHSLSPFIFRPMAVQGRGGNVFTQTRLFSHNTFLSFFPHPGTTTSPGTSASSSTTSCTRSTSPTTCATYRPGARASGRTRTSTGSSRAGSGRR